MSNSLRIDAGGRDDASLAEEILRSMRDGRRVILALGKPPSPERVLTVLHAVCGNHKIDLIVRDATLEEHLKCAWSGANAGAFTAGAMYVVLAIPTGGFSLMGFFGWTGTGGVVGAVLGFTSAPIARIEIYKDGKDGKDGDDTFVEFIPPAALVA
jgi:hypothetical protein